MSGKWDCWIAVASGPHSASEVTGACFGVLEWAGNKPELKREWDLYIRAYIRARREDDNRV